MKLFSALLFLALIQAGYAGSIDEDVNFYDYLVTSANDHLTKGENAINVKKSIIVGAIQIGQGEQAIEIAKRQQKVITVYLDSHPNDVDTAKMRTHLTAYNASLDAISQNLVTLETQISLQIAPGGPGDGPFNGRGSFSTSLAWWQHNSGVWTTGADGKIVLMPETGIPYKEAKIDKGPGSVQ